MLRAEKKENRRQRANKTSPGGNAEGRATAGGGRSPYQRRNKNLNVDPLHQRAAGHRCFKARENRVTVGRGSGGKRENTQREWAFFNERDKRTFNAWKRERKETRPEGRNPRSYDLKKERPRKKKSRSGIGMRGLS